MSEDPWDEWNRRGATNYPQNKVVQFCFRQFRDNMRGKRALDLGCGSGVHTLFLASEGFEVAGTDKSPVGIANTQEKLARAGLAAELKVEGAEVVSFPANSFDLVICIGILDTVGPLIASSAVGRVKEVLAPGGMGFFLFSSDLDNSVKGENAWGFHGYTRSEVDQLFAGGLSSVWVDRCNITYQGGRVVQDEWIVTVQK